MSKAKRESIRQSVTLDQWTSGINTTNAAAAAQLQTSGRSQGATGRTQGAKTKSSSVSSSPSRSG